MVGALLPDVVDVPFGGPAVHALAHGQSPCCSGW